MRITVSCLGIDAGTAKAALELAGRVSGRLEGEKGKLVRDYFALKDGSLVLVLLTHDTAVGKGVEALAKEIASASKTKAPMAEIEFEERPGESITLASCAKAGEVQFNRIIYQIFSSPASTPGLALDPKMRGGFKFEIRDGSGDERTVLDVPAEAFDLYALIGFEGGYAVGKVYSATGEEAACASCPGSGILVSRGGKGFPGMEEVLAAFKQSNVKAKCAVFSVGNGILAEVKQSAGRDDSGMRRQALEEVKAKFRNRFIPNV